MLTLKSVFTAGWQPVSELDAKRPAESYARLYDDILDNQKVAQLSPAGFGLYCAMISYCHRNDTDGKIPPKRARGLLHFTDTAYDETLGELRAVEMVWEEAGSLHLHDYLGHNASHAERIAKRIAGANAARIRWGNGSPNGGSNAKVKEEVKGEGERLSSALNVPSEESLELAVLMEPLLGHSLSVVDIQNCGVALSEYRYFTGVTHFAKRAEEHNQWCQAKNQRKPQTVAGYFDSWRRENDYMGDSATARRRAGQDDGLLKPDFKATATRLAKP